LVLGEGPLQLGDRGAVVEAPVDAQHLTSDRGGVRGPDGVSDVVVAAAHSKQAFFLGFGPLEPRSIEIRLSACRAVFHGGAGLTELPLTEEEKAQLAGR